MPDFFTARRHPEPGHCVRFSDTLAREGAQMAAGTELANRETNMARQRKTRDCWRFYLNYGQGWEHEITENTFAEMKTNRKAYRENCNYPLRIVKGRERIENLQPATT